MAESILRRYNFKLYPNRIQSAEMDAIRRLHCTLYNAALQQRIDAYRLAGVSLTHFTQGLDIKTIRADDPAYAALSADSLSATLKRLDLAYQAFYRRAKAGAGKEAGFPKYKRSDDYPGFGHRSGQGWKLSFAPRARKGTMYVKGVTGQIALRGKFPGPPISVRTCDIKLHGGIWWASIAVELPARMRAEQQHSGEVTFDLVDHFARVRRVNGGHAAGPEDTVYAAADGRIFPVFEGVTHQTESSDEHQWSVGLTSPPDHRQKAESSDETEGSVGRQQVAATESPDERRESVGWFMCAQFEMAAGSSDETARSVGGAIIQRNLGLAESPDESQGSVGGASVDFARGSVGATERWQWPRPTESSVESQGSVGFRLYQGTESSVEHQGSVGTYQGAAQEIAAGPSHEHQGSVGLLVSQRHQTESSHESQGSVGWCSTVQRRRLAESSHESQGSVGGPYAFGLYQGAESSIERQGSVGCSGRDVGLAESSVESQGSVGHGAPSRSANATESSVESQGSVGRACGEHLLVEAGSSVEHQGSVGSGDKDRAESPDESQGSVGVTRAGLDVLEAGSSVEHQRSVGTCSVPAPGCRTESPDETAGSVGYGSLGAGSSDETQKSVGCRISGWSAAVAGSSDETQASVGAVADAKAGESVGALSWTQETVGRMQDPAGSFDETQETVGVGAGQAGSPDKTKKTVGSGRVAGVKDLQRGMAKCKRGSRRYRYRRRIKAKREARVARQRRESLHVWSTTLVRRYASLVIIKPPLVEATQSGAGTEREPGAAVGLKAEVNRHVLDQAPGLAISMLEYKLAERGGTAKIIETRAAPVLAGNLMVAATKANRRLKRTAARA